jgi:hypothetical protein
MDAGGDHPEIRRILNSGSGATDSANYVSMRLRGRGGTRPAGAFLFFLNREGAVLKGLFEVKSL